MTYRKSAQAVFNTFLTRSGETSTGLRQAVFDWSEGKSAEIPQPLTSYLSKVARHAYKITDQDTTQLKTNGYSEDEIFELTIAAALGASKTRLDKGLQLLQEAE